MPSIQVQWHAPLLDGSGLTNRHCAGEPGVFHPDTMTDLRAIGTTLCLKIAFLKGYTTAGDGYGGVYYWDQDSTAADDGLTTIIPNDAPPVGRWIKLL